MTEERPACHTQKRCVKISAANCASIVQLVSANHKSRGLQGRYGNNETERHKYPTNVSREDEGWKHRENDEFLTWSQVQGMRARVFCLCTFAGGSSSFLTSTRSPGLGDAISPNFQEIDWCRPA
eukprot:73180-Amphidinium_carterae.1